MPLLLFSTYIMYVYASMYGRVFVCVCVRVCMYVRILSIMNNVSTVTFHHPSIYMCVEIHTCVCMGVYCLYIHMQSYHLRLSCSFIQLTTTTTIATTTYHAEHKSCRMVCNFKYDKLIQLPRIQLPTNGLLPLYGLEYNTSSTNLIKFKIHEMKY